MSSLKEISIAVRAENRSSMVFRSVGSDLLMLAQSFGIMDSATGRAAHAALTMMHLMTSMVGILNAYTGAAGVASVATTTLGTALSSLGPYALVIIAVAAAVGALAYAVNSLNQATKDSQNIEASKFRSLTREGELEYYRKGVDQP